MSEHQSPQEFKNENLSVTVKHEPECVVAFDVTLTPAATEAAHEKALRNVSKEIELPGFRKGKAPKQVVMERYKKAIQDEFRDIILNTTFQEVLKLTNIYPYSNESVHDVKLDKLAPNEPASIKYKFEQYPQVPAVNPAELILKKVNPPTIDDGSVQEVIERIRRHHAQWEEIIDRPIQQGDDVELELELRNPALHEPQRRTGSYEVVPGKMDEKLLGLVIGKQVNESFDGTPALNQPGTDGEIEANTTCVIKVNRIRHANTPELDDELAKKAGATDVANLKDKIIKSLEKQLNDTIVDLKREQVQLALLQKYPFELPRSLLQAETQRRLDKKIDHMKESHFKEDEINKLLQKLEEEAKTEAEQYLRLQFLIFKLADEQKITVSKEDILQQMLKTMMHNREAMNIDSEELRKQTVNLVTAQKALDYVVDHAQTEE